MKFSIVEGSVCGVNYVPNAETVLGVECPACGCTASTLMSCAERTDRMNGGVKAESRHLCDRCRRAYTVTTVVAISLDDQPEVA